MLARLENVFFGLFCICLFSGHCQAMTLESFLEPFKEVKIIPPGRDVIAAIHVREGEIVTKGQLLITLRHDVLKARRKTAQILATTRGRLDSAETILKMRTIQLDNLKKLKSTGHVRVRELENAEAERAIAAAELLKAQEEKSIRRAELLQIDKEIATKKLLSPFDGVVTRINKTEGELVGVGDGETLIEIVQVEPLRATFYVPTTFSFHLRKGQELPLLVDSSEEQIIGRIEFIAPVVSPESGTVRVRIELPKGMGLKSGIKCRIELDSERIIK